MLRTTAVSATPSRRTNPAIPHMTFVSSQHQLALNYLSLPGRSKRKRAGIGIIRDAKTEIAAGFLDYGSRGAIEEDCRGASKWEFRLVPYVKGRDLLLLAKATRPP